MVPTTNKGSIFHPQKSHPQFTRLMFGPQRSSQCGPWNSHLVATLVRPTSCASHMFGQFGSRQTEPRPTTHVTRGGSRHVRDASKSAPSHNCFPPFPDRTSEYSRPPHLPSMAALLSCEPSLLSRWNKLLVCTNLVAARSQRLSDNPAWASPGRRLTSLYRAVH